MGKHNAAVYILSSRTSTLKKALELFYQNWNNEHQYPVYVFHFDDIYDERFIKDIQENISSDIQFRQIDYGVPDHIPEKELFYNRIYNPYVRSSFPPSRLGYLHMEYFSSNFHKFGEKGCVTEDLKGYDYIARIDDDSWFKEKIDFDFFDDLEEYPLSTGFTWNHCGPNHIQTRENLWGFYKAYLKKYDISTDSIKDEQLRNAVENNYELGMHTLRWSCGNFNAYNVKAFLDAGFEQWMDEVNKFGGLYKHRWGDLETLGLFAYTFLDNPLHDWDFRGKGVYEPKLPETEVPVSGYAPSVKDTSKRI